MACHTSPLPKKALTDALEQLNSTMAPFVEQLKQNKRASGIERFIHYFYEEPTTLFDYLDKDTIIFFDEPQRIAVHAQNISEEIYESLKNRIEKGYLLPKQSNAVLSYAHVLKQAKAFANVLLTTLTHSIKDFSPSAIAAFEVKSSNVVQKRMDLLEEDLRYLVETKQRILLLAGGKTRAQRLVQEFLSKELAATYLSELDGQSLQKGIVTTYRGGLCKGFEYPLIGLCVLSGKELLETDKRSKKRNQKRQKRSPIESFSDLAVGDYVVHDSHGVGVYRGIERIAVDNVYKDYLKISYKDGGSLFVAVSQLDVLQKYIGGDNAKPKINSLGGSEWNKAKAKVRSALAILAEDLVALYAKREASTGYVYGKDTVWQTEFEELFPYEETDDQLTAIEEVKQDMESPKVMDRLICGDVGYGKTEIAIRAAFKAVQDGKQVAYLVPTTILAQQHYNTFVQRMKDYPINIGLLSRFRTKKQQDETISNLATGGVDVVIGTHRLLSSDVSFRNLGLIVVDEEQRFGVAHKEKLKRLKENVDVLTLTATPIPRTLHMSITGIKDMSVLEEPPQERQPIQTYVMEYNPEAVRDAINREVARGGQVYYLHNRVRNIAETAARVAELVPNVAVSFAHGQMSERELENVMMDFIEGEVDVLVCTTIIETGLDISNVNTIIIADADYMGLSQLYQLRGRVGRSNRSSYAYLMYRKDKVLTEVSEKRLQTIREFTEFGSGFKIAMRDLEIRGAGNLLGAQQHGHMDTVGYELYCKLLAEAVNNCKGIETQAEFETLMDITVNAYIPPTFIENEMQKLDVYKKIALIQTEKDYYDVQEEIEDRFGNLPKPVQNLLEIALLKGMAHSLDMISVMQKQNNIMMSFKHDAKIDPIRIGKIVEKNKNKLSFTIAKNPFLRYRLSQDEGEQCLTQLKELFKALNVAKHS